MCAVRSRIGHLVDKAKKKILISRSEGGHHKREVTVMKRHVSYVPYLDHR
jgi:hypothetical protein